jgi:hypothetical protein
MMPVHAKTTFQATDTSALSNRELIPLIVDAALFCICLQGEAEQSNTPGFLSVFRQIPFVIVYRTPETMVPNPPGNFGIDVWYNTKKQFAAYWDSNALQDYNVMTFKRGPWIPELLALATSFRSVTE